jgi:hypothetical protein
MVVVTPDCSDARNETFFAPNLSFCLSVSSFFQQNSTFYQIMAKGLKHPIQSLKQRPHITPLSTKV